jgi:hypothetical protein
MDFDTISTVSPALNLSIDRLQKKQADLEDKLTNVANGLSSLYDECRLRNDMIYDIQKRLDRLEESKADKSELLKMNEEKANKSQLKVTVNREDFDNAIRDMSGQINRIFTDMMELETNWKSVINDTQDSLKMAMSSKDMESFKKNLESRLKTLKNLLETTRAQETRDHGTNDSSYHKHQLRVGDPVASIPLSGHLPHIDTIRPYTAFDLHNIRSQGKYGRTGYDERVWMKTKNKTDHNYRKHVAESLNYAFNAYEEHDMNDSLPIQGGSSIPKGYAITQAGRSCGAGHTLTNPHIRFTNLRSSNDEWGSNQDFRYDHRAPTPNGQPSEQRTQQQVAEKVVHDKVEQTHHETEILGSDGHIYKGRFMQGHPSK